MQQGVSEDTVLSIKSSDHSVVCSLFGVVLIARGEQREAASSSDSDSSSI